MARSSHITLLSLDQWAENLGINPWVFNQFDNLKIQGKTTQCQEVWYQRSWNGLFLSRDEISYTIAQAERLVAEYTRIWIAPKYFEGEKLTFRQPRNQTPRSLFGVTGKWKQAPLKNLYVQNVGKRIFEKLDDAVVTIDPSNFEEPFSVAYTNASNYALEELQLVFPEAERNAQTVDDSWIIRPLQVTSTAGVVTFRGPNYLLTKPTLQNVVGYKPLPLDPTVVSNYVGEVEVYRIYIDTSHTTDDPNQGIAIWEVGNTWWEEWCDPDCSVYVAPLCLQAHDSEAGVVRVQVKPENWPLWSWAGTRGPDQMQVNYLAGMPLENRKVDPFWADIVTKLSVSMLPAEQCGCARHDAILRFWRMLPSEGAENSRPLSLKEIENPFGPRRGARYAWERIERYILDEYVY